MFAGGFETRYRAFCRAHAGGDRLLREPGASACCEHLVCDRVLDRESFICSLESPALARLLEKGIVVMPNRLVLDFRTLG